MTLIDHIKDCIKATVTSSKNLFDDDFIKLTITEKRQRIKDFQTELNNALKQSVNSFKSETEFKLSDLSNCGDYSSLNDSADILANGRSTNGPVIIVEIDATRADQVAKKMLSRFAYMKRNGRQLIYVALLYPGTKAMNEEECRKYFLFGNVVLMGLNNENRFIGGIINKKNEVKFYDVSGDLFLLLKYDAYREYLEKHNYKPKTINNKLAGVHLIESILSNGSRPISDQDLVAKVKEIKCNLKDYVDNNSLGISPKSIQSYKSYINSYLVFLESLPIKTV